MDEATTAGSWAGFTPGARPGVTPPDQLPTTHPVATDVGDSQSALLNFDGISYAKGAAVLRQLMTYVGRDAFFAGVRAYLDRHAWGNTTLADLLASLSEQRAELGAGPTAGGGPPGPDARREWDGDARRRRSR